MTEDEEEIFISNIQRVRTTVRKIKNSPTLEDQLKQIQSTVSGVGFELKLVLEITKRSNSVHDTLSRFLRLRTFLNLLPVDIKGFAWNELKQIVECLQPLVDLTLDLQKESANAETAVNVIRYLTLLSSNNQQM